MFQHKTVIFRILIFLFFLLGDLFSGFSSAAQVNLNLLGKNPTSQKDTVNEDSLYAHMEVPSKAMGQKKFNFKRRFFQNLYTRYNFFYNARSKLRYVLETVKELHQDNYQSQLPFYPFTLLEMSPEYQDLDSVILNSSIGIEVHDPRVKWMDDLYFLVGEAYYYKQEFAEAEKAFQYINLFYAPKRKDQYSPIIGSRTDNSEPQISIASPEDRKGILHKFRKPGARNEALLWLAKSYMGEGRDDQAEALLNSIQADPNFPHRLQEELQEFWAFFYYSQHRFRHTIPYLEKAIALQQNDQLRARWEFILGQLFRRESLWKQSINHFQSAVRFSSDPLLQFYGNFFVAQLNINQGYTNLKQAMQPMLEMSRKAKYERYLGVIFYGLAEILTHAGDTSSAQGYLLKSLFNCNEDPLQHAKSAKLLADLYYSHHQYQQAKNYYDTTSVFMGIGFPDSSTIMLRKTVLDLVVAQLGIIQRQDSLQYLATLPESRRDSILNRILDIQQREQRKQERLKQLAQERLGGSGSGQMLISSGQGLGNNSPDQRGGQSSSVSWYFDNPGTKATGFTEFQQAWGQRPLVDNWRRSAAIQGYAGSLSQPGLTQNNSVPSQSRKQSRASALSALQAGIPLTPEKMRRSNDSVADAYFTLGSLYYTQLGDLAASRDAFGTLMRLFPANAHRQQVFFISYIMDLKTGQTFQADSLRQILVDRFPQGPYARYLNGGSLEDPDSVLQQKAMAYYDQAFQNYEQGNYDTALSATISAASLYPRNDLQPKFDLLHAILLIRTGSDSLGKLALEKVVAVYPKDPVKTRAQAILDVLAHKEQLITYLSSLKTGSLNHPAAIPIFQNPVQNPPSPAPIPKRVAVPLTHTNPSTTQIGVDSSRLKPSPKPVQTPPKPITPYYLNAKDPQFVIMLFRRTDKQLIEGANTRYGNYLKANPADSNLIVSPYALSANQTMLIFRPFSGEQSALNFLDQVETDAPGVWPQLPANEYSFYIISRTNFILLNQTKDLDGYIRFFNDNYVTQ